MALRRIWPRRRRCSGCARRRRCWFKLARFRHYTREGPSFYSAVCSRKCARWVARKDDSEWSPFFAWVNAGGEMLDG